MTKLMFPLGHLEAFWVAYSSWCAKNGLYPTWKHFEGYWCDWQVRNERVW